ncbi:MAG: hypothetical protein IJM93_02665 [Oscillospiraceae bacterium]|nr:hypothetical protein [Oscillospiraceae bacterium]
MYIDSIRNAGIGFIGVRNCTGIQIQFTFIPNRIADTGCSETNNTTFIGAAISNIQSTAVSDMNQVFPGKTSSGNIKTGKIDRKSFSCGQFQSGSHRNIGPQNIVTAICKRGLQTSKIRNNVICESYNAQRQHHNQRKQYRKYFFHDYSS